LSFIGFYIGVERRLIIGESGTHADSQLDGRRFRIAVARNRRRPTPNFGGVAAGFFTHSLSRRAVLLTYRLALAATPEI
jgi:hypothetical protein